MIIKIEIGSRRIRFASLINEYNDDMGSMVRGFILNIFSLSITFLYKSR